MPFTIFLRENPNILKVARFARNFLLWDFFAIFRPLCKLYLHLLSSPENCLLFHFYLFPVIAEEETPEPQLQNIAGASAVSSNSFASLSKLTGLAAGQEPTDTSIFEGKNLGKSIITCTVGKNLIFNGNKFSQKVLSVLKIGQKFLKKCQKYQNCNVFNQIRKRYQIVDLKIGQKFLKNANFVILK